jgi:SAM-dependent methyltransferase
VIHPERIVPDETEPGIVALHRKRYEFALPFCARKEVLDAGCGVGYGSALLGESARRVVGVDNEPEAIEYARRRYGGPNVEFVVGDLLALDLPDASFDVVCSFETIEHLPDRERYLGEMRRVLRGDGTFLLSTPRAESTTERPLNPHHAVELSQGDLEALLRRSFEIVELYGQQRIQTGRHRLLQRADILGLRKRLPFLRPAWRLLGTRPMAEVRSQEIAISREGLDRASELIAVCR